MFGDLRREDGGVRVRHRHGVGSTRYARGPWMARGHPVGLTMAPTFVTNQWEGRKFALWPTTGADATRRRGRGLHGRSLPSSAWRYGVDLAGEPERSCCPSPTGAASLHRGFEIEVTRPRSGESDRHGGTGAPRSARLALEVGFEPLEAIGQHAVHLPGYLVRGHVGGSR